MKSYYEQLAYPPPDALRQIQAGDLKNFTDIKPQWRIEIMDKVFGACGTGWKYEIVKMWDYPLSDGNVLCFVQINLYIQNIEAQGWSDPIPGIGGNTLVDMVNIYGSDKRPTGEKRLKANDEGYKMALTDAMSNAMKLLGVGAAVYRGQWSGSKYTNLPEHEAKQRHNMLETKEIVLLKGALIDYINSGMFDHPENVNKVIADNNIEGMRKALAVAKEKEKKND